MISGFLFPPLDGEGGERSEPGGVDTAKFSFGLASLGNPHPLTSLREVRTPPHKGEGKITTRK
jgi:hypothetical protein